VEHLHAAPGQVVQLLSQLRRQRRHVHVDGPGDVLHQPAGPVEVVEEPQDRDQAPEVARDRRLPCEQEEALRLDEARPVPDVGGQRSRLVDDPLVTRRQGTDDARHRLDDEERPADQLVVDGIEPGAVADSTLGRSAGHRGQILAGDLCDHGVPSSGGRVGLEGARCRRRYVRVRPPR
jgi:hypothetical protein